MLDADPLSAYLQLAEKVFMRDITLNTLSAHIPTLPLLDRVLLDRLTEESEKASHSQPRMSWAICCVAEKASRHQKLDLFTCSLAAWYLGHAANRWVQPKKVSKAISRARRGFLKLGETDWVAVCDWQINELPWTRPDFTQSNKELVNALAILEKSNFSSYSAQCRLALSYSQILLEEYAEAQENIEISEKWFFQNDDIFNYGHCLKNKAILLRRTYKFDEAKKCANAAGNIFQSCESLPDLGMIWNILGMIELFSSTSVEGTLYWLEKAKDLFANLDMPIWVASEYLYIGIVYNQDSQLEKAMSNFKLAENILTQYYPLALLADTYTSQGKTYLLNGQPSKAIKYLQQAHQLHKVQGMQTMVFVDYMGIAEANWMLSRYQIAIKMFEELLPEFTKLNNVVQMGFCEMRLAQFWLSLKNYKQATNHVTQAEEYLKITNQLDSTISIILIKARIAFETGSFYISKELLEEANNISRTYELRPQFAFTQQLLGEVLISLREYEEAEACLSTALDYFITLGQEAEQCNCLILLGKLFFFQNDNHSAQQSYYKALQINNKFPENDWRIYAGLAETEEGEDALHYYRLSIELITFIRSNIWQEDLSGHFSQKPSDMFRQAVELAFNQSKIDDLFSFIEADKANTLNQQLVETPGKKPNPLVSKLEKNKNEINLLKKQLLSISPTNSINKFTPQFMNLQSQLNEKKQNYDKLFAQLDRQYNRENSKYKHHFLAISSCRKIITENIGTNWAVCEYYQLDNEILLIFFTNEIIHTRKITLNQRLLRVLRTCEFSHQNTTLPSSNDLSLLGESLIPQDAINLLNTDTTLFIIPHQKLHGIPWATIGKTPLATKCIPSIIPSLSSMSLLWNRKTQKNEGLSRKGLVVGISKFNGRHSDLPHVLSGVKTLVGNFGEHIKCLIDNEVSMEHLNELLHNENKNNNFDFLHIATHFFSDPITGRLSSFAFSEEDIWLEQIRDLSPLPELVTLSGCNSILGQLFAGDEQINLSTSCLISGASSVIGCVWPILDQTNIIFMNRFYNYYLSGNSPAKSICLTQRDCFRSGEEFRLWAGYCCIGIP